MKSALLIVVGVVAVVAGGIWALQGWGVIGGSFMSGSSAWAVIGPAVAVAGLIVLALGLRSRSAAR
jgi:hypothetical protein